MKNKKPQDYIEAIKLLDKILNLKQKDEMLGYDETKVGPSLYFSLGLWIKDNWILDPASPLGQHILSKNPKDLDEYIHLIIKIYHRYISGKPLKLENELLKIEGTGV